MRAMFILPLLLATATTQAVAAPRDYAAAVAFKGRPGDAVALDAGRKPAEILDFMGLKPGMKAIDMVTGSGYYAEIMAQAVGPKGTVVAFEPQGFIDDKAKAALAGLMAREPNLKLVTDLAGALTPNAYDFAMIHLTTTTFTGRARNITCPGPTLTWCSPDCFAP